MPQCAAEHPQLIYTFFASRLPRNLMLECLHFSLTTGFLYDI